MRGRPAEQFGREPPVYMAMYEIEMTDGERRIAYVYKGWVYSPEYEVVRKEGDGVVLRERDRRPLFSRVRLTDQRRWRRLHTLGVETS